MSPRDWRVRVEDILEAIERIQGYLAGMEYEQFVVDQKTMRACAYDVGIIGEAAQRVPTEIKKRYSQIPWGKIQALRNIVFHEYFRVGLNILWETIRNDLPPLAPQLQQMLDDAQAADI